MRTEQERLASYKAALLEKIKRTNWNDEEECNYKRRGRKPKPFVRYESRPRSKGEEQAAKLGKYNWL